MLDALLAAPLSELSTMKPARLFVRVPNVSRLAVFVLGEVSDERAIANDLPYAESIATCGAIVLPSSLPALVEALRRAAPAGSVAIFPTMTLPLEGVGHVSLPIWLQFHARHVAWYAEPSKALASVDLSALPVERDVDAWPLARLLKAFEVDPHRVELLGDLGRWVEAYQWTP